MVTILLNSAHPFKQIVNTPSTEGPIWYLVKIKHGFREDHLKITYLKITCFYTSKNAQGQGQITLGDKIFIVTKKFYHFNLTL